MKAVEKVCQNGKDTSILNILSNTRWYFFISQAAYVRALPQNDVGGEFGFHTGILRTLT